MQDIVIDTNVLVAALRSGGGASRQLLRKVLTGQCRPVFGNALWAEYEDLLQRDVWGEDTTAAERQAVLAALAQQGRWVSVHFGWRPNLPDEADNHLIELAVAAGASCIVTHNLRDLNRGELRWAHLQILTPAHWLAQTTGVH